MSDIDEFQKYASKFTEDEWEDLGLDKIFIAGMKAARAQGGEAVAEIHKFGYGRRRTTVRHIEDLTKYPEGTKLCLCLAELK